MKDVLKGFGMVLLLACTQLLWGQTLTQTIKGKVVDRETQIGLPGATIILIGSDPIIGVTTDVSGFYKLENIPLGRVSLKISFMGYEPFIVSEMLVNSGKEIVLNISLKELFSSLEEVVIIAEQRKEEALNKMASVSARTFSVEDAQRYAGGMDDPSRLASMFAGVTPSTVDNNEIVIRGNAAKGILWRLEGVEIPAPNHLAGMFSGGGVNTMFSNNMLANSDFLTGAFPAEYGNALSGVFDMNLRIGNTDKGEYAFQVGSQGIDVSAEGPFSKGKRSSYLINYRYSTIGLLQALLPDITGLPTYSDLSFKLNFPTRRAGVFSLWGINGIGDIANKLEEDPNKWETNMESFKYDIGYNLTAFGLYNKAILNPKTFLFTSASFSATDYVNHNIYYRPDMQEVPVNNQKEADSKLTFSTYLNHKFNSRHSNKTGFIVNQLNYNYEVANNTNVAENSTADFLVDRKGSTYYYQFYTQSKRYLSNNFSMNLGVHLSYFELNDEFVVEPRIGLNWEIDLSNKISVAYGKHSKIEPLRVYEMKVPIDNNQTSSNEDLALTKAHHLILSYDLKLSSNTHLKIEPYIQKLYDVPVIADSSFSMVNYTSETFFTNQLFSTGTARNIGVDLTLERFMMKGYYYLLTASIYESKYKGGDGIERNTRYNQNFVFNVLAGKEWQTKRNHTFGINSKFTVLGGKRQSPVNYAKSKQFQFVIYDDTRIFEYQLPTSYYIDLSLNYTINKPKYSQSIIFQAKNLLMQEESLGHAFNYKTNEVEPFGLTLIFPYISYKIQF